VFIGQCGLTVLVVIVAVSFVAALVD